MRLNDFDFQVAADTYPTLSEIGAWEAKRRVYYKLLRFPELVEGPVSAFYEELSAQSAGQFAQADYALWQALRPSASLQDELEETQENLKDKQDSLLLTGDVLAAGPTGSLWTQQEQLSADWIDLMQEREQLRGQIQTERKEALEDLATTMANLPQNTLYEQARVEYLQFAIQKGEGGLFSAGDLEDIRALAQSNEEEIGYTAGEALMLLPADDSLAHVMPVICSEEPEERQVAALLSTVKGNAVEAFLFPNPAERQVQCRLSKSVSGATLSISNLLGISVVQISLQEGAKTTVDVGGLANGVYWCVLRLPDGVVQQQKLLISR